MSTQPAPNSPCTNPILGLAFGFACNPTVESTALGTTAPAQSQINGAINTGASDLLNTLLQPFLAALPGIGVKVGLFLFALLLVIVGFTIVTGSAQ